MVCAAAALMSGAQPVPTQPIPPRTALKELQVLDDLDRRSAMVQDLQAEFQQRKFTALLKEPLVSSGTILVKGDRVRWDTKRPHPTITTIDPAELRIYYPEQRTVEVYPVTGELSRLTASPIPRMSELAKDFTITVVEASPDEPASERGAVRVLLTPIHEAVREHVKEVRVLIDQETGCARRLDITDMDGERTEVVFSRTRINTGLNENDLELKVPKDTVIVRPLEAPGVWGSGGAGDRE